MLTGDGIRSGEPASAPKRSMLSRQELLGAGQIAEDPVRDAERVDADRLTGSEALTSCELERALEPRHRDVGRVARDAELSQELERSPLGVRVADLGCDGVALLDVWERPPEIAPLRKSIAAAASSASARSAVRCGAAARASSKRRCASWRSIRRNQNGPARRRSAARRWAPARVACRAPLAGSRRRGRAAASRARRSASTSAQRACRSASAALSPASSSRSRA